MWRRADAYAHAFGVPYFKDSTPPWSTRGKLRSRLQPLLREVYGEGVGSHLTSLAKDSSQCAALVEAHMLRPFWRRVVRSRAAVRVDVAPYLHMPVFFWREALRHVCEVRDAAQASHPTTPAAARARARAHLHMEPRAARVCAGSTCSAAGSSRSARSSS